MNNSDWTGLEESLPSVYKWLERNKNNRFFLFLQTYVVHDPYSPPKPFKNMFFSNYNGKLKSISIDYRLKKKINKGYFDLTDKDIDYMIFQYDGGIRYTDFLIKELIN